MNKNQRKFLIVIGVVFVAMIVFPPFTATVKGVTFNGGFAFIFTGPSIKYSNLYQINAIQLFAQWLFVVGVGFVGWHLLKGDK